MNRTFTENSRRIKDLVRIEEYISALGIQIGYGNRCECPVCKGRKGKMAINTDAQKVTCFGGCIRWGDVIDLHGLLNNLNQIESLNDLIKTYSVKRVMANNYKPVEHGELAFKAKVNEHFDKCLSELEKIAFLKYEVLERTDSIDYCYSLRELINAKRQELRYNKYNKEELRGIYKNAINFINYINSCK